MYFFIWRVISLTRYNKKSLKKSLNLQHVIKLFFHAKNAENYGAP
jgi:hypothetical protein